MITGEPKGYFIPVGDGGRGEVPDMSEIKVLREACNALERRVLELGDVLGVGGKPGAEKAAGMKALAEEVKGNWDILASSVPDTKEKRSISAALARLMQSETPPAV